MFVARHVPILLHHQQQQCEASLTMIDRLVKVVETLLTNPQKSVRVTALHSICNEYLYPHAAASHHDSTVYERQMANHLIRILLDVDLSQSEKGDIFNGLVRIWVHAA
jgi:hypothetical protein